MSVLAASRIRARGFDAETTRDAKHLHQHDDEQLAYAAEQQRTLLTHNRADFEALHGAYRAAGLHHASITIAVCHPPYEIVRRLLLILK